MRRLYSGFGLTFSSELELPLAEAADGAPDVEITMDDRPVDTSSLPPGRPAAELDLAGRRRWTGTGTDDSWHLRIHGICDFVIDADLRSVTVRRDPAADPALVPVMTGTFLAFLLTARGEVVLHGSAVRQGENALAVVGPSGSGKTTLCAALCRQGARLLTDDLLCVSSDGALVLPGIPYLRLRPGTLRWAHASRIVGTTADGRTLVAPLAATRPVSLRAIILPRQRDDTQEPYMERLTQRGCFSALLANHRLTHVRDSAWLARHFDVAATLATHRPGIAVRHEKGRLGSVAAACLATVTEGTVDGAWDGLVD